MAPFVTAPFVLVWVTLEKLGHHFAGGSLQIISRRFSYKSLCVQSSRWLLICFTRCDPIPSKIEWTWMNLNDNLNNIEWICMNLNTIEWNFIQFHSNSLIFTQIHSNWLTVHSNSLNVHSNSFKFTEFYSNFVQFHSISFKIEWILVKQMTGHLLNDGTHNDLYEYPHVAETIVETHG